MKGKRYFETPETPEDDKKGENSSKIKKKSFKKSNKSEEIITIQTNLNPNAIRKTIKKTRKRLNLDKKVLEKYRRGDGIKNFREVKTIFHAQKIKKKEKAIEWGAEQSARTELLRTEELGILEADDGEVTQQFRQKDIVASVDISAATKHFELHLTDFGPYRLRYTRNGRHLLLGGEGGHIAAFDWMTKRLHCEINVLESVHDVCWLHLETMFAVAQRKWLYMYDNQGIELHCIKRLSNVLKMEFLPYHFLLAASNDTGYLSWLDVSIGEMVTQYNTKLGRLTMMTQNPYNAVICLGHSKGVVSMWSPKLNLPLAKMLCHRAPMTSLAINANGTYMATAAVDNTLKIWDIRKLEGPVQHYRLHKGPSHLAFSQKNFLALGIENIVEVYQDPCTRSASTPYLRHKMNASTRSLQFCSYEDVLGVGTTRGFTSLIIPGAGEPNYDALEANPYQTKSQRREAEVKALLEKIPSDLICLDPNSIGEVDVPTVQEKLEQKKQLMFVKVPKVNLEPRKKKIRGASVKAAKTKKILKEDAKRKFLKDHVTDQKQPAAKCDKKMNHGVLNRFVKKA